MKYLNIKILILSIAFCSTGTLKAQGYDCYKVGDVIHSVLDTTAFYKLHGNKWRLLSGQNIDNTDLAIKHGFRKPIDARGVFIKSADNSKPNDIGVYQADALQAHDHVINLEVNATMSSFGDRYIPTWLNIIEPSTTYVTSSYGGEETRPRNISLYIYIKVYE